MIGYGGRGGGGGFGGFPYRSSHQQGQDGRRGNNNNNNNRGGGRGGRGGRGPAGGRQFRPPNHDKNSSNPYYAELQIPQDRRGIIVGKGGSTLKWIKEVTNAKIFVPQHSPQQQQRWRSGRRNPQHNNHVNENENANENNDRSTEQQHLQQSIPQNQQQHQQRHPVRVNANDLPSLIHAFCEISCLLSQTNLDAPSIPCSVKMKSIGRNQRNTRNEPNFMDINVEGELMLNTPQSQSQLSHSSSEEYSDCHESLVFRGAVILPFQPENNDAPMESLPQLQLAAYVLETILEEDDIATIVDNIRFVDSSAVDSCQWYFRKVPHRFWCLERHQQLQKRLLQRHQSCPDGNTVGNSNNGERTLSQLTGDENAASNGIDRDDSAATRRVVFVFGSNQDRPEWICRAITDATAKAWTKLCCDASSDFIAKHSELGRHDKTADKGSKHHYIRTPDESNNDIMDNVKSKMFTFSIGSYNLLHPTYALKYHQPMGLNFLGRSNWNQWRAPAISSILEQSALDVYFLQEVDADQLKKDIMISHSSSLSSSYSSSTHSNEDSVGLQHIGNNQKHLCLAEMYESVHFTHPTREARDGVAILVKTSRFEILESVMVPFTSKLPSSTEQSEHIGEERFKYNIDESNNHYMCAATAIVRDKLAGLTFLLACVHLYDKKCVSPQKTLLNYIQAKVQSDSIAIDAIIWGGDCNTDYGRGKDTVMFDGVEYHAVCYPGKRSKNVDDNESLEKTESCSCLDYGSLWGKDKKIDWLFYRAVSKNEGLRVSSSIDEKCIDFMARTRNTLVATHFPPSDHLAVAATISVTKC